MAEPTLEQQNADKSAKALLERVLSDYGLSGLVTWAWGRYLEAGNADQVMLELRERPEYAARFPYMKALGQQGRAINEQQAIDYERSMAQLFQAYGIPKEMYDQPDDFTKMITSNVSVAEMEDRVKLNQQSARAAPEVQQAFSRYYGADGDGLATAYWMDPDRALPVLEQRLLSAQAAGQAERTKFGTIQQEQAERLARAGYDVNQLMQGFASLAGLGDVRKDLVGETDRLDPDTLIRAQFEGDTNAQRAITGRQQRRTAAFKGGGGFTSQQEGFTGIGAAR